MNSEICHFLSVYRFDGYFSMIWQRDRHPGLMRIEPSGASAREVEEEHVGLAMQSTTDMQEEITRVARAKLDLQRLNLERGEGICI